MATRDRTTPARAGECPSAPIRLIAPGGPVTSAVQARDPVVVLRHGLEDFFASIGVEVDFASPLADVIARARISGGRA